MAITIPPHNHNEEGTMSKGSRMEVGLRSPYAQHAPFRRISAGQYLPWPKTLS